MSTKKIIATVALSSMASVTFAGSAPAPGVGTDISSATAVGVPSFSSPTAATRSSGWRGFINTSAPSVMLTVDSETASAKSLTSTAQTSTAPTSVSAQVGRKSVSINDIYSRPNGSTGMTVTVDGQTVTATVDAQGNVTIKKMR